MNKIYQWVGVVLSASMLACTNEDYKLYDISQKDAVFFEYRDEKLDIATSIDYNFGYNFDDTYTIEIPVKLMGMPVDYDRQFELAPVAEGTDMREDVHYRIEGNVIPANEVMTTLKVILLRDNDPALLERSLSLVLSLVENDNLRAVGQTTFTITYSDIHPQSRPEWWSLYDPLPEYSFEAAQVFFKYFYENAPKANNEVFNTMINLYGDYFVNAVSRQGPLTMYSNFLTQYVLVPMYEDYKDAFVWQDIPSF